MQPSTPQLQSLVHFGFPCDEKQTVSESLKRQGIKLLKASPSDIRIRVERAAEQPAYKFYLSHLAYYSAASVSQTRVALSEKDITFKKRPDTSFPLTMPTVCTGFPSLTQQAEDVIKTFPHTTSMVNKRVLYSFENPTVDQIDTLLRLGAYDTTSPTLETINIAAFKKFSSSATLVALIVSMQSYPAFHDQDHLDAFLSDQLVEEKQLQEGKDKESDPDGHKTKRARTGKKSSSSSSSSSSLPQHRYYAKPQGLVTPWEIVSSFQATGDGVWCPYVDELAKSDKDTVPNFIDEYCLQNLSSDFETQNGISGQYRSAWGSIGKTRPGRELTHITKCTQIALECQGRPVPLFDKGMYAGTVIYGAGFRIELRSVHEPCSPSQLNQLVKTYTPLSAGILALNALGCGDYSEVGSMYDIHQIALDKGCSEEEYVRIRNLACTLRFFRPVWAVNSKTILDAFTLLEDPSLDISHLPIDATAIGRSREELIFSAFGVMAPTFLLRNQPEVKLDLRDPPTTLAVTRVSYSQAALDFKTIKTTRIIHNNPKMVSGRHVFKSFDRQAKKDLWRGLSALSVLTPFQAEDTTPLILRKETTDIASWI